MPGYAAPMRRDHPDVPAPGTLVVDGRPVAAAALAGTRRARSRGLLGASSFAGALLLTPCRSVHTFGMRFTIDVAICDRSGRVLAVHQLPPGRVTLPRRRGRTIVEAMAGSFDRWGLVIGSTVQVSGGRPRPER